ncbi:hypothetical protein LAJ19_11070 [Deinococcus taeanensis]|uniref:hypothetical protein n=1 Tax=Deinococcus taeanensis TaxID=2737050 RepID=UPI001CDBF0D6|nr:hypothetical protein [Deinococcus taeanensis]UBV42165.1 hypothetical protein LAJ19_11070 [Deinococcus taeanensis]
MVLPGAALLEEGFLPALHLGADMGAAGHTGHVPARRGARAALAGVVWLPISALDTPVFTGAARSPWDLALVTLGDAALPAGRMRRGQWCWSALRWGGS